MKKDIKIFVSHRIDLDSVTIDNPLYVPVRCGAVFDKRENVTMLGDDTGDNISEKRMSFCELTVQYWAWKNVEADYYGLCHYRRYLSFKEKDIYSPSMKQGFLDSMSVDNLDYCQLRNEIKMRKVIEECDILVSYSYDFKKDWIPNTSAKNIYEGWLEQCSKYVDKRSFEVMLELIKKKYPAYYDFAFEYMHGNKFRGFNCFVMKKEAFHELCKFEFEILFDLENRIDVKYYSDQKKRTIGYLCEWLYSIWIAYQEKTKKYKVKETQLVTFANTDKEKCLEPLHDDSINIVCALSDNNRAFIANTIASLIQKSSEKYFYDIILLQKPTGLDGYVNNLVKMQNKKIKALSDGKNHISIRFLDADNFLGKLDIREFNEQYLKNNYYIALLPYILHKYNKVLYLAEHTIVNSDLSKLFHIDMKGKYVAASRDIIFNGYINGFNKNIKEKYEEDNSIDDLMRFCSTDVMLLDLAAIRSLFQKNKLIDLIDEYNCKYYHENSLRLTFNIYNNLFRDKMLILNQEYNKALIGDLSMYLLTLEYITASLNYDYKNSRNAQIYTLKTSSFPIPDFNTQASELFWKYARVSGFYEEFLLLNSSRLTFFTPRVSKIRSIADQIFPKGSKKREFLKAVLPKKGSFLWNKSRTIYYLFFN